ncbi:hypothetical protein ACFLTI_04460 [Bacteroidota bacterium]
MKRKSKYLIGIIVFSVFLFISCKKDDITNSKYPDELLGTWRMKTFEPYYKVVTNSDQTIWDFFSEGDGAITLTGDYQVELKYIYTNGEITFISNAPASIFNSDVYNYPIFFIMIMGNNASMEVLISGVEGYLYLGTSTQDFVDLESFVTTFDNLELINSDGSAGSIIANGSLSPAVLNIPANITSEIFPEGVIQTDGDNLIFNTDGNALKVNHHEDSIFCSWEVKDDLLYIVDTSYHQFQPELDTTVYSYSIISNTLTLIIDYGTECEIEDEKEECMKGIEEMLFLDEGSLTDVSFLIKNTYSRSTAVFGNKSEKQFKWHNIPEKIKADRNFYKKKFQQHFKL